MRCKLFVTIGLVVMSAFSLGCAGVVQTYQGPKLPEAEVATLSGMKDDSRFLRTPIAVVTYFDERSFMEGGDLPVKDLEMLPGQHKIGASYFFDTGNGIVGAIANKQNAAQYRKELVVDFKPGKKYALMFKEYTYSGMLGLEAVEDVDLWVEDLETGEKYAVEQGKANLSTDIYDFDFSTSKHTGVLKIVPEDMESILRVRFFVKIGDKPLFKFSNYTTASITLDEGEYELKISGFNDEDALEPFDPSEDHMSKIKIEKGKVTEVVFERGSTIFSAGEILSVKNQ